MNPPAKPMAASRAIKTSIVLPGDTNTHDTLFGGILMKYIDEIGAISALRHGQRPCVTASNDGVHFHRPIKKGAIVNLESYVASVGRTSMEIFVKITTEHPATGEKELAAISYLTFVALDDAGKPASVPEVYPESPEEKVVYQEREVRREARSKKRNETNDLIQAFAALK